VAFGVQRACTSTAEPGGTTSVNKLPLVGRANGGRGFHAPAGETPEPANVRPVVAPSDGACKYTALAAETAAPVSTRAATPLVVSLLTSTTLVDPSARRIEYAVKLRLPAVARVPNQSVGNHARGDL
jgi:hypothetical protein